MIIELAGFQFLEPFEIINCNELKSCLADIKKSIQDFNKAHYKFTRVSQFASRFVVVDEVPILYNYLEGINDDYYKPFIDLCKQIENFDYIGVAKKISLDILETKVKYLERESNKITQNIYNYQNNENDTWEDRQKNIERLNKDSAKISDDKEMLNRYIEKVNNWQ